MRGGVIEFGSGVLAEAVSRGRCVWVTCPGSLVDMFAAIPDPSADVLRACDLMIRRLPTGDVVGHCPEHGTIAVERPAGRHVAWLAAAYFGGWEPADVDPLHPAPCWVFDSDVPAGGTGIAYVDAHIAVGDAFSADVSLMCCPAPVSGKRWVKMAPPSSFVLGRDGGWEVRLPNTDKNWLERRFWLEPCERCVAHRAARLARTTDVDWADSATLLAEGPR